MKENSFFFFLIEYFMFQLIANSIARLKKVQIKKKLSVICNFLIYSHAQESKIHDNVQFKQRIYRFFL